MENERRMEAREVRETSIKETSSHYEYRFSPQISDYRDVVRLADIVNTFVRIGEGGIAAERAVTSAPDQDLRDDYLLQIPKTLRIDKVRELFERLNTTGLVNLSLSEERYAPSPEDDRMAVRLNPGEQLVATVKIDPSGRLARAGWRIVDAAGDERAFISAPKDVDEMLNRRNEPTQNIFLLSRLTKMIGSEFKIEQG